MRLFPANLRATELATYLALVLVGAGAAAWSLTYGLLVEGGQVGPGLLPLAAGVLVCAISLALLVRTWRAQRVVDTPPSDETANGVDRFGRSERQRVRIMWIVFGLLLVTLLLAPLLGFLPAFGLFVFVISKFIEHRPWWGSLLVAALAVVVLYVVFVLFLNVPLPGGPLHLGGDG